MDNGMTKFHMRRKLKDDVAAENYKRKQYNAGKKRLYAIVIQKAAKQFRTFQREYPGMPRKIMPKKEV